MKPNNEKINRPVLKQKLVTKSFTQTTNQDQAKNQTNDKDPNNQNSCFLFWCTISKLVLEFLNRKDKTLELFCTLGWNILEKVARYYNFNL